MSMLKLKLSEKKTVLEQLKIQRNYFYHVERITLNAYYTVILTQLRTAVEANYGKSKILKHIDVYILYPSIIYANSRG